MSTTKTTATMGISALVFNHVFHFPGGDPTTVLYGFVFLVALGVDYSITHSCYDPVGDAACGRCDACVLRRKGFADANVTDPTRYAAS